MERTEILEQIKELSFEERIVIIEETLKLIRGDLQQKAQLPVQPNGEEVRALTGLLLAFRELDQPLVDTEIDRQMEEAAKEAMSYYSDDEELAISATLDNKDFHG